MASSTDTEVVSVVSLYPRGVAWEQCTPKRRGVRRGLFLVPKKKHRFVTTKILLPDMFFRCDTREN